MTEQEVGEQPIALYRLFAANDVLLYVGITDNPRSRFVRHAKEQRWWPLVTRKTITWQETRKQALRAETEAIRTENPLHNIRRPVAPEKGDWRSESRQRTKLVVLRLLPEEERAIKDAAGRQQISISALIRRAALKAVTGKEDKS